MKKIFTKYFKLTLALLILTLLFSPIMATTTSVKAQAEEVQPTTYLTAPTLIEADEEHSTLFVYDKYAKQIIAFDNSANTLGKSTPAEILDMAFASGNLFALKYGTQNNVIAIANTTAGETYLTYTDLNYDEDKHIEKICVAGQQTLNSTQYDAIIYAYYQTGDNSGVIDVLGFKNQDSSLTREDSIICSQSISDLYVDDANLYITKTQGVSTKTIKFVKDGYNSYAQTEVSSSDSALLCNKAKGTIRYSLNSDFCLSDSNNSLNLDFKELSTDVQKTIEPYEFALLGSAIYLTDPSNQTIWKYDTTTSDLNVFLQNTRPEPTINSSTSFIYIKVNEQANLYASPYSITPSKTIESGTHLVIIANDDNSYANFKYCLYTEPDANYYYYLPASTDFEVIPTASVEISAKVVGSREYNVYSLPTSICDTNNKVVTKVTQDTSITQTTAQIIINSHGEGYYQIKTSDDKIGYIRFTQISSAEVNVSTEKVKCNGRTKRSTIFYICPNANLSESNYADEQIAEFDTLNIGKSERIYLMEKIEENRKFSKAVYQTADGTTYYGYTLTEDVKSDKLSPLQTVGLVLVLINIVILAVIFIVRNKYNRSQKKIVQDTSSKE